MVRNNLSPGIKLYKTHLQDVIVCKLEKHFFKLSNDVFIVNAYVKPANTSCITPGMSGLELLRDLDDLLTALNGQVLVVTSTYE